MKKEQEKALLRKLLGARRAALGEAARREAGNRITQIILATPQWERAKTIFTFCSVGTEPDTYALMEAAFTAGKRVCVPLCVASGQMTANEITSFDDLVPDKYHIPAPRVPKEVAPDEIDLVLVPGYGFDIKGYRIGYGGGYYDRFLGGLHAYQIGLCFEALRMGRIPTERHDRAVDAVVTEKGIFLMHPAV